MIEIKYEDAASVLYPGPEGRGGWASALCPAHPDSNPSLGIMDDNGLLAVNCKTGCPTERVLEAVQGLLGGAGAKKATKKSGKKRAPKVPKGKHVASYMYSTVDGLPLAVKKRYQLDDEKTFMWCDPQNPDVLGLPGTLRESELPLYNIEDVVRLGKKKVVFVEGEKAADALKESYGVVATCLPGGSASELTAEQMEPLKGRWVVLWPDNDEPGRSLMRTLSDKLSGVAKKITMIMPYVPPKGDAYDYVKAGHTKEQLREEIAVTPQEAVMQELPDGYEVSVPDTGGVVKFRFLDLENKPREINADIVVWREMTGAQRVSYSARQNLQSASARSGFVRQLSQHFGPDSKDSTKAWSRIVDTAYGKVQETQRSKSPDEPVMKRLPPGGNNLYLVDPLVADDGMTIPFGMGGAGKSYLALLVAVLTALPEGDVPNGHLGLDVKRHGPVLYLDYEASRARAQRRVAGILRGLGKDPDDYEDLAIQYWPGQGMPLSTNVYPVRKRYTELGAVLLIVDSLSKACGEDLSAQETVSTYSNALARIGATASISIAHVTKEEGSKYPFGSVFWHNDPRLTWYVHNLEQGEGMGVMVANRKSNDAAIVRGELGYKFEFTGTDEDEDFTVTITREDNMEPPVKGDTIEERILKLLSAHDEGMTPKEIMESLQVDSIGGPMGRLRSVEPHKPGVTKKDGRNFYRPAVKKEVPKI